MNILFFVCVVLHSGLVSITQGNSPLNENVDDLAQYQTRVDLLVRYAITTRKRRYVFEGVHDWLIMFSPVGYVLQGIIPSADDYLSCKRCQISVKALSAIAHGNVLEAAFLKAFSKLCQYHKGETKNVCNGLAESSGKAIYYILGKLDIDIYDIKKMICFSMFHICSAPDISIQLPQLPSQINSTKNNILSNSVKHKQILHLSDLHLDRFYREGTEADCNQPVCCQKDSKNTTSGLQTIQRRAKKWGDYNCDTNKYMLASLLKQAKILSKNDPYEMILFTGDLLAHDLWKEEGARAKLSESNAFRLIKKYFRNRVKIYPAIGNHEAVPVNLFPRSDRIKEEHFDLYDFLADIWEMWLPTSAIETVRKGGYYSVEHDENLKVIVVNNNPYYIYNFYNLLYADDPDPNGMFNWMINELQDAELSGKRVYLVGHIPPGAKDFYPHWSDSYNSIIERFHHILSGQFYGHLHTDEFEIFYNNKKSSQTAIGNAYLAPSIGTLGGKNPSFRVYQANSNNFEIFDYTQHYADLKYSSLWENGVEWKKLYNARDLFLTDASRFSSLNATFWHLATEHMQRDKHHFDLVYRTRNAKGLPLPPCDSECRARYICALQSSRAKDNCQLFVPFS